MASCILRGFVNLCEKALCSSESLKVPSPLNKCCKRYSHLSQNSRKAVSVADSITVRRIHSVMAATSSLLMSGEPGQHFLNSFRKSKKEQKHSGSKMFCRRRRQQLSAQASLFHCVFTHLTFLIKARKQQKNKQPLLQRSTYGSSQPFKQVYQLVFFLLKQCPLCGLRKRSVLFHCQRNICYYYYCLKSNM